MATGLQEEAVMGEAAVVPSAMGGGCTVGQAGGGQRDERAGWVRWTRMEMGRGRTRGEERTRRREERREKEEEGGEV